MTVSGATPAARRPDWRRWTFAGTALLVAAVVLYFAVGSAPRPAGNPDVPRLVVLPFENLGAPEDEYFADGMTDELTARLVGLSGLAVIARQSAMLYKQSGKTPQQIGQELDAEYLLEATVSWQRAPDGRSRIRIRPQLVRTRDATHVWAEIYDDDVTEVFAVQSRIASRVVEGLGVALLERERRALTLTPTRNAEAHDYYLRGLQGSVAADRLFDGRNTAVAIQLFEKAVVLDPGFAHAHAALSRAHRNMYWWAVDRRDERLAMAKQAADRALEIDPELLEGRLALALYFYARFDYGEALAVLNELRQRHPHNVDVVASVAAVLRRQGQLANSATLWEEAVRLSPRSAYLASNLGETYWLLRNFEAAEAAFSRANALGPGAPEPYAHRIQNAIGWHGATGEAWRLLEQAERLGLASEPLILHHRIWLHVLDRDFDRAAEAARHATGPEAFDWQFWFVPRSQWLGEIHGLRGEPEIARRHYEEARDVLEERERQFATDPRYYSSLGIVYAGLGRAEDAVRTARRGVELLPLTKEALRGAHSVEALARVYTMTGHRDAAVAQLSELLSRPSHMSARLLRLDPRWDPLRGHPGFEQLLRAVTANRSAADRRHAVPAP